MQKDERPFNRKTKTYRINYFQGLGELFKGLNHDRDKVEAVPGSEAEKSVIQKEVIS